MAEEKKKCIFCAEEIQAEARLCRFCGREQVDPEQTEQEEVFYDGSVLHRTFVGAYILYGMIMVGGLALAFWAYLVHVPANRDYALVGLVIFALGALGFFGRIIKTGSLRWKITSQRIQTERGVLAKRIEVVELWRVEDISYAQSVWERLLNEAKITLTSMDKSTPKLVISGLTHHRELYEKLRAAIEKRRRQQRVIAVESHHEK